MAKKRVVKKKPSDDSDPIGGGEDVRHTHQPIPRPENPPAQPAMVPAKQVPGATGSLPNVDGAPPSRIDPKTAIRVQASDMGYYDDIIRRVGDVFDIRNEKEFSKKWMVRVPASTPERITGSNEALERARKSGDPEVATGDDDPLGAQR